MTFTIGIMTEPVRDLPSQNIDYSNKPSKQVKEKPINSMPNIRRKPH
jgi:hypothetical protein